MVSLIDVCTKTQTKILVFIVSSTRYKINSFQIGTFSPSTAINCVPRHRTHTMIGSDGPITEADNVGKLDIVVTRLRVKARRTHH